MKLRLALLSTLAAAACAPPEDHDVELETHADLALAGTLDCAARTATGYRDGAPFDIVLVTVDGRPVERRTANAFDRLRRAAAAQGVTLAVVSGFRSYDEQARLRACYETCSCNACNLAARPGYSNHQSGSALDLDTSLPGAYRWLSQNAARFAFAETVPGEDWHWEYLGGLDDEAPCVAAGGSALAFVTPRDGGAYGRDVWMKVAPPPGTHHVTYAADGLLVGANEDPRDGFSARYGFAHAGPHTLDAIAYDRHHRAIARAALSITVDEGRPSALALRGLTAEAWLRNGVALAADAGPEVAAVRWMAGPYVLARSTDRARGFAHRAVFQALGWRVITAVAEDAAGGELERRSVPVRVMPGDDRAGPVALALFDAPGATRANGAPLRAVGSDVITRVRYQVDGYALGESTDAAAGFPVAYRFSVTGARRLVATGYDAAGRARATDAVDVVIR